MFKSVVVYSWLLCYTGVGKGLVGVVTRPAGGVIDFASTSFAGIRKYVIVVI